MQGNQRFTADRRTAGMTRAFTILELLIVVGILALLIGILVPSLAHAREQARAAQCTSNLHQLAITALGYVSDYDNAFPLAQDKTNQWNVTQAIDTSGNAVTAPGILFRLSGPGTVDMRIEVCPDYLLASNPSAFFNGYDYNTSFIGHGCGENQTAERTVIVPSARDYQLMHPATTALFGDQQAYLPQCFMRAPAMCNPPADGGDWVGETTRVAGTQGYRHSGRTNVAWADGHAEAWGMRVTKSSPSGVPTAPNTGFLSADNSLYSLK